MQLNQGGMVTSREVIEVGSFTWSRIQRLYESDATGTMEISSHDALLPATFCARSSGHQHSRSQFPTEACDEF